MEDHLHVLGEALRNETGDEGERGDEEAHEGDKQQKELAVLDFVLEDCALEDVMRLALRVSRRIGELIWRRGGQFGVAGRLQIAVQTRLDRRRQEERIGGRNDSIVMQIASDVHIVVQAFQADQQQREADQRKTNNQQFDQIFGPLDIG